MMNFDVEQLVLISPCELSDEVYRRALHASSIVDNAFCVSTLKEATADCDYLVGTSSIIHARGKKHLRTPVHLHEFVDSIRDIKGTVGLLFGREDYGLYNEEIAQCDILLNIPTSESYLALNLSHAVCIVLSYLYIGLQDIPAPRQEIGPMEKEKLFEYFSSVLDIIQHPDHKRENTELMFQRLMGRAIPTRWEYHTLMGVFSSILKRLQKRP